MLCFCRCLVKADVFALGTPRGARRSAIDVGRFHRNEKPPVIRSVASDEGRPPLVIARQLRGEGQLLSSCCMPHGHGSEMNARWPGRSPSIAAVHPGPCFKSRYPSLELLSTALQRIRARAYNQRVWWRGDRRNLPV